MKKIHSFLLIGFCLVLILQACEKEPVPELTVTASQLTIEYGTTATISWVAINATACSSDVGNITGVSGSVTTPPLIKTTTYSFSAIGPGGTVTSTITIQVNAAPKPILKVTADNDTIRKGETVNLLIESTNAVGIHIKGVTSGDKNENTSPVTTEKTFDVLNGAFLSWPIMETTQFTITATGIDGSVAVAQPIIVIPTRTDTICGRYWMVTKDSKYLYEGIWHDTNWNEDQLTRKWFYYKNGTYEIFKKSGELVGNGHWSWSANKDSIEIAKQMFGYQLTDTTLIISRNDGNSIGVNVYKGFTISTTPR